MKNIVASVGLVALGASGFQNAQAQSMSNPDSSKPWSVGLTLRGFYDDNVSSNVRPNAGEPSLITETFGYDITPSLKLAWSTPQTSYSLGYAYGMKYYENRPTARADKTDNTHSLDGSLEHRFTERVSASVSDSFVIGQEADFLRAGNAYETFHRASGNNVRNFGRAKVTTQLSSTFGATLGYENGYYNYDDSYMSSVLDRVDQTIPLEGLVQLAPETRLITGYRFRDSDFNSGLHLEGTSFLSEVRNSRSHTGYVGVDHNFTPDLTGSIRGGAESADYYNDPNSSSELSPYAQASVRYTYAQDCSVEVGVTYDRTATDMFLQDAAGNLTLDAQTLVVYGSLTHKIASKVYGSLLAQIQNSDFNGGKWNNRSDLFFTAGVNFEYRINQHLSANAGYDLDRLDSDTNRSFTRNRVYVGVKACY